MRILITAVFIILLLSVATSFVHAEKIQEPQTGNVRRREKKEKVKKEKDSKVQKKKEDKKKKVKAKVHQPGGKNRMDLSEFFPPRMSEPDFFPPERDFSEACSGQGEFKNILKQFSCDLNLNNRKELEAFVNPRGNGLASALQSGGSFTQLAYCGGAIERGEEAQLLELSEDIVYLVEDMIPFAANIENNPNDRKSKLGALALYINAGNLMVAVVDLLNEHLADKLEFSAPGNGANHC